MTIIAVAPSRGTELLRIPQILALHYGAIEGHTAYVEVLRPQERSLYCTPNDLPPKILRPVAITSENVNLGVLAALEELRDARTVVIDLGRATSTLSDDLLKVIDIVLVPTVPAQPSIYDAVRIASDIMFQKAFWALHDLRAQPWIMGAGCVGGGAIAARLRHAAQRLMVREPSFMTPEILPILNWGLPLTHWSVTDNLLGLGVGDLMLPPGPQMNAFQTLYRQVALLAQHPDRAPTIEEMRADSPRFYEPWFYDDLRTEAERHADLSEDLHMMMAGLGPLPDDLANAAQLDEWHISAGRHEALTGTVSSHPSLMEGDYISTSQLVRLGMDRKWARTFSRYYRLSEPAVDPGDESSTSRTTEH